MRPCISSPIFVFPTRVGMARAWYWMSFDARGFPHTRGDGPPISSTASPVAWFSPHAWGWPDQSRFRAVRQPVFPTRVGMARSTARPRNHAPRFPHTRGDGPGGDGLANFAGKFSPHAWGWPGTGIQHGRRKVVFPTRVGMARSPRCSCDAPVSFPHTRGDGPVRARVHNYQTGFSPHAWGWPGKSVISTVPSKVFPTRVGMAR